MAKANRRPEFKDLRKIIARYRVTDGKRFRLKQVSPADTHELDAEDKPQSRELLARGVSMLAELQDKLYAQDRRSLLVVFQAMDAAGKDGTIKHVMSGVNPAGVQVHSFKAPSPEELDHDYLWRCARALPERGRIGIFNRSYYEEVLVVRVHREILAAQKLPADCAGKDIFKQRMRDIASFEDYLGRNGTRVLKFYLHVSKDEQKKRFLERIEQPEKNWKFAAGDVKERVHWDEYMAAYEDAIRATASEENPWYVVPADNKWFTRLVVVGAIVRALEGMDLAYPKVDALKRKELQEVRQMLLSDAPPGASR
jgi:PPK2 family polyphosphate:nucleotide phosphotransferase